MAIMTFSTLAVALLAASGAKAHSPWSYGNGKPTSVQSSKPAQSSETYQGTGPYAAGVYINYTSVPGYFLQDDPSTNATTFDYVW